MIVWRNPRAELGHGRWGVDDYLKAQIQAAEVVKKITGSDTVNWLGLCAGGITTALMLGYLAATGDASAGSATFIVTMLTNRCPNIIGMMDTAKSRSMLRRAADDGEVFPGRTRAHQLRLAAPQRPGIQLPGQRVAARPGSRPPSTCSPGMTMPPRSAPSSLWKARSCSWMPWSGRDGITVLGTPIDLAKVDCDSFHVAGYTDHITPWRAAYTSTQVLGGDKELAVVKSGHIQSFVNPAAKSRYDYWEGPPASDDPGPWLAGATEHHGSWWPQWLQWLTAHSGPEKAASSALGNRKYPPLGAGPRHLRAPVSRETSCASTVSVALVTGAASGLGRAAATQLRAAGAKLVLVDTDRDGGQGTRRRGRRHVRAGRRHAAKPRPSRLCTEATALGPLRVLVNCAWRGLGRPDRRQERRAA